LRQMPQELAPRMGVGELRKEEFLERQRGSCKQLGPPDPHDSLAPSGAVLQPESPRLTSKGFAYATPDFFASLTCCSSVALSDSRGLN
jgi:hypothetical protein